MSGWLFIIFLGFALLCKCGINYYRSLLISLLCQFVAFQLPNLDPLFRFALEWYIPIMIMTFTTLQENSLGMAAKGLFLLLSGALSLFGIWDYKQSQSWDAGSIANIAKTTITTEVSDSKNSSGMNWSLYSSLPSENQLKTDDSISNLLHPDEWEELTSNEGHFRVLSPLPGKTRYEKKQFQKYELQFTNTRIKDVHEGVYYVILTTQYPLDFPLPTPQNQAQEALSHLASSYEYDVKVEMEVIQQAGIDGLGFHLKRSKTGDHLIGLVLPFNNILYQVLVFTNGDDESSILAEKFLSSFSPLDNDKPSNALPPK